MRQWASTCPRTANALLNNHTLQELHLSGNEALDAGGFKLAELLRENQSIRRLHLDNCSLGTRSLVNDEFCYPQGCCVEIEC